MRLQKRIYYVITNTINTHKINQVFLVTCFSMWDLFWHVYASTNIFKYKLFYLQVYGNLVEENIIYRELQKFVVRKFVVENFLEKFGQNILSTPKNCLILQLWNGKTKILGNVITCMWAWCIYSKVSIQEKHNFWIFDDANTPISRFLINREQHRSNWTTVHSMYQFSTLIQLIQYSTLATLIQLVLRENVVYAEKWYQKLPFRDRPLFSRLDAPLMVNESFWWNYQNVLYVNHLILISR